MGPLSSDRLIDEQHDERDGRQERAATERRYRMAQLAFQPFRADALHTRQRRTDGDGRADRFTD